MVVGGGHIGRYVAHMWHGGPLRLPLKPLHFGGEALLCLATFLRDPEVLDHRFLLHLPLLELCGQGDRLLLQCGPLLMILVSQLHQLLIILLRKSSLQLFHLLVNLHQQSPLLLFGLAVNVVQVLFPLLIEHGLALRLLLVECSQVSVTLHLYRLRVRQSGGQGWRCAGGWRLELWRGQSLELRRRPLRRCLGKRVLSSCMRVRKCRRTVSLSSVVAPSEGGLLHWNMQWWLGRLGGRNKPCLMLLQLLMQMLLLQLLLLSHPRRVLRCTWRLRKAGARCTVARC